MKFNLGKIKTGGKSNITREEMLKEVNCITWVDSSKPKETIDIAFIGPGWDHLLSNDKTLALVGSLPVSKVFSGLSKLKIEDNYTGKVLFKDIKGYAKEGKPSGLWEKFDELGNVEAYVLFTTNETFTAKSFYPDSKLESVMGGRYIFKEYSPSLEITEPNYTFAFGLLVENLSAIFIPEHASLYDEQGLLVEKKQENSSKFEQSIPFKTYPNFEIDGSEYTLGGKARVEKTEDFLYYYAAFYIANLKTNKVEGKILIKRTFDKRTNESSEEVFYDTEGKNLKLYDKISANFEIEGNKVSLIKYYS